MIKKIMKKKDKNKAGAWNILVWLLLPMAKLQKNPYVAFIV